MSDNVVKFRPMPKKPDPKANQKPPRKPGLPGWVPWAGVVALAVLLYLVRQPGLY